MAFTTRKSLLAKVRNGDEIAWAEFYATYKPLILLIGGDHGLTYDEKQELIQTIAKFQMGNDYKGALFTEFLKNEKPLPPMSENYAGPIREIMKLYRG